MINNENLEKLAWNDTYWTDAKERIDAATDKDGRIWILTTLFTIDTVVGLYAYLILVLKFQVEDIQGFRLVFDEADVPDDVAALDFDATIGARYRDRKIGSATEAMLIDWADHRPELGIVVEKEGAVVDCAVPGVMAMLRMLRRNNESGYLKNSEYQFSFAWLMRKVEYLQREGETFEQHHGDWLGQMISVIEHCLQAMGTEGGLDVDGFRAAHPDIVRDLSFGEKIKEAEEYLLTLPGYLVALHSLFRIHPDDIKGEHGIFRAAFDDCKRVRSEAEADAERLYVDIFHGRGGHRSYEAPWGQVLVVRSDNQNATGFLFEKFTRVNLIVAITSRGHAAFMPRDGAGIVLDDVAKYVIERERDRWRYMKFGKKWLLLNGGSKVRFLVKPTELSPDELSELAIREVTLTEKAKNRLEKARRKEREEKAALRS